MSLKTIKVNPIFLMGSGGGGGLAKNKTRKEKPTNLSLGQPNNIKKKLIARIKNFQQEKKTIENVNSSNNEAFVNDFSESVQFLDDLARGKQEHKLTKRNATLKKKQPYNPDAYMQIATELPPELLGGMPPLRPPVTNLIPTPAVFTQPFMQTRPPQTVQTLAPQISPLSGGEACVAGGVSPPWNAPPAPSYSNLKTGGTKPTYRTWLRNTQKNKHVLPLASKAPISILEELPQPVVTPLAAPAPVPFDLAKTAAALSISTIQEALEPIQEVATLAPIQEEPTIQADPNGGPGVLPPLYRPTLRQKRKKITRTLKYKLGKHTNGKVSVLIKNNQTRRRVQTEQAQLKQKSMLDIKNYLRSKNLLKVGSEAPNDVLRHIYEQSILAGQIENKSKDTLIHNYFNDEKK